MFNFDCLACLSLRCRTLTLNVNISLAFPEELTNLKFLLCS